VTAERQQRIARAALNQSHLLSSLSTLLASLEATLPTAPHRLRLLAHALQHTVTRKFPSAAARHAAVSGMLFLRFFCPALMTTQEWLMEDGRLKYKNKYRNVFCVQSSDLECVA
jgi:hypothetical protein